MTVREKLAALREKMTAYKMDMYLIGSEDFHGSEYVGEHFKCRAFISGFTGSAGTILVTQDFAGLWTDGRYFLQAEAQLADTGIELFKMGNEGVPTIEDYIVSHIEKGQCLGFDGRTVNARNGQDYVRRLSEKGASVNGRYDLVDEIWTERPALSADPAWLLDIAYAGQSREDRIALIRQEMAEKKADWFVLTSLDDIAWLLNFRGNDVQDNPVVLAYLMMSADSLRLYTNAADFKEADRKTLENAGVEFFEYNGIYEDVAKLTENQTVIYDGSALNYAILERMPESAKKVDEQNLTLLPKAIKNPVEVANIRQAHIKDGIALTKFMYWLKKNIGKVPMTEISAAEKMESFRKEQEGYLEPSFEPISGYAEHGAIVHYSATEESDRQLKPESLLLVDSGGHYLEGTTDITRTFALGPVTDEMKDMFTRVCRSNMNLANAKFKEGCSGLNFDILAREPFWEIGMDYNHGTGHGVGYVLNVHEGPNSFHWKQYPGRTAERVIEEGMVTTDEPGIYLEGKFGIRTENELICRKGEKNEYGQFMYFENLTYVPIDLDAIDPNQMTDREKGYLNAYHARVYELVSPFLNDEEAQWLKKYTRAI